MNFWSILLRLLKSIDASSPKSSKTSSRKIKSRKTSPPTEVARIKGAGEYEMPVVGESHYQRALAKICGGRTEEGHEKFVEATLVLEDSNPHDNNAVRIDIEGKTVGYLSREEAPSYRQRLKEAGHPSITCVCSAIIRGGWDRGGDDKGHFGVFLDIPMEK